MIDFSSEEFLLLPTKKKKEIVIEEFIKCKDDFEYYINNYAYIRHPNRGIIKMSPFDFQLDIANSVVIPLKYGRNKKTIEEFEKMKTTFDYKRWLKNVVEKNIELSKKIPFELHEFYTSIITNPLFYKRIDPIILKSRQTGISTIFQQINLWHINFYVNAIHLIVSMTDREAKKYLADVSTSYKLLPNLLKAKRLKDNDHELNVAFDGKREHRSTVQALPPGKDVGRSYSPNLIVLDEFAAYRNPEEVWTAISMAVSGGGIIAIISTPKGMTNLFYQFWDKALKSLNVVIEDNIIHEEEDVLSEEINFKPFVAHWSQLPEDEFHRRGFKNQLEWYNHMCNYLSIKEGEKSVAQELDIQFLTSGNTLINGEKLKLMKNKLIEQSLESELINKEITGLKIFEYPIENCEYILGVDVAEGKQKEYSTIIVLKIIPPENDSTIKHDINYAKIVAQYKNNRIIPRNFANIILKTAIFYNNAYINVENNNAGKLVIDKILDEYDNTLIMNTYNINKRTFNKDCKGWDEKEKSRDFLLNTMVNYIYNNFDDLAISVDLYKEFLTFIDTGKRYEHMPNGNDDLIFAYALAIMGSYLLPKFKEWLIENKKYLPNNTNIGDIDFYSSDLYNISNPVNLINTNKKYYNSKYLNIYQLRDQFTNSSLKNIQEKRTEKQLINFVSKKEDIDDIEYYIF